MSKHIQRPSADQFNIQQVLLKVKLTTQKLNALQVLESFHDKSERKHTKGQSKLMKDQVKYIHVCKISQWIT